MSNGSFSEQSKATGQPDRQSNPPPPLNLDGLLGQGILSSLYDAFHATSILVCSSDGTVIFANKVAIRGFPGKSANQIIGHNLRDIAPKDWATERIEYIKLAIKREKPLLLFEILAGSRVSSTISPIRLMDGDKNESAVFITVEPVTPMKLKWLRAKRNPDDLFDAKIIDMGRLATLTPREIEVLALMGDGLRQKQIAEKLHRSVSTIDRHRERIGEKLGITDRIELVALAREAALEVSDSTRTNSPFGHKLLDLI